MEEDSFVASISLLPYFGAGSKMIGLYACARWVWRPHFMNNGKIFADACKNRFYGSDSSIAPVIRQYRRRYSITCIWTSKSSRGFLAVMTEGESMSMLMLGSRKKAGYTPFIPNFCPVESLLLLERSFGHKR